MWGRRAAAGVPPTTLSYSYDHLGRMVQRREEKEGESAEEILLPFFLTPEVSSIYTSRNGEEPTLSYSYTCDPQGTRLSQRDHTRDPEETTYPVRSPRSDVLLLLGEEGSIKETYAYSPYGEAEEGYAQAGTPFLYQDDYRDPETSLYAMQARWYDPASSSFLLPDPEMGQAQDPRARLPYAYCAGDPVYNSDPSGKTYVGDEGKEAEKTPLGRLAAALGYESVVSMLLGRSGGKKRPLPQAIRETVNRKRAEARAQSTATTPSPEGTYLRQHVRTIFEPDYDRNFWHDPWLFPNEPKHESYPNTYTEWKSVPANTSQRNLQTSLFLLSAIFKGAVAGFAAWVGLCQGALDVGASAIEDFGYAISYSQPVDIAWRPYFYVPR